MAAMPTNPSPESEGWSYWPTAVSVPMRLSRSGVPNGFMLSAEKGKERLLLELAYEIEQARPFLRIQDAAPVSADAGR